MLKRRIGCLVIAFFLFVISAAALDPPVPEQLLAPHAILYNVESGQIVFEKDAETPVPPASVTKLMTALVALEHLPDLSVETTVSQTAVQIDPDSTRIGLVPGEVVTLKDMMYATLVHSANDAANVIAEYVGKTQQGFAAMMNERAAQLGADQSHFENAHGLDAGRHYMSARDVALVTQALLEDPRFVEISGTQSYTMPPTNKYGQARTFQTKQHMLVKSSDFYNPYAIAGKNGYTSRAQHTQATVAQKDGLTWIAVSMGASGDKYDTWRDMQTLFDYGMEQFHAITLTSQQVSDIATRALNRRVKVETTEPVTLVAPVDADIEKLSFIRNPDRSYSAMLRYEGEELPVAQMEGDWETEPIEIPQIEEEGTQLKPDPRGLQKLWLGFVDQIVDWLPRILAIIAMILGVLLLSEWWKRYSQRRLENRQYDYVLGMRTHKKRRKKKKKTNI